MRRLVRRGVDRALPQLQVDSTSGVTVTGAIGTATVLENNRNMDVCKGFVNSIDTVLLPFDPATSEGYLQPLEVPRSCTAEEGANYSGEGLAGEGTHLSCWISVSSWTSGSSNPEVYTQFI